MRWRLIFRENAPYLVMAICVATVMVIERLSPQAQQARHQAAQEQATFLETFKEQQRALEERIKQDPQLAGQMGAVALALFLFGVIGLYLDGRWLGAIASGRRFWFATGPPVEAAWGVWDLVRLVIAFLFMASVTRVLTVAAVLLLGLRSLRWVLHPAVMQGVLDLAAVLMVFRIVQRSGGRIAEMGWRFSRFLTHLAAGALGYLAILPVFFASALMAMGLAKMVKYEPPPEAAIELVLREGSGPMLALLLILIVSIGPMAEEIVFRGFAYPALRKRFGAWWGMVVNSGCFALLHGSVVGFLPIFSLGMVLSYLYEKTGSLLPCIMLHLLHNSLMVSLLLALKELL